MYTKIVIFPLLFVLCESGFLWNFFFPEGNRLKDNLRLWMNICDNFDDYLKERMLCSSLRIPLSRRDDPLISKVMTKKDQNLTISGLRFTKMSKNKVAKFDSDLLGRHLTVTVFFRFIKLKGNFKDRDVSKLKNLDVDLTRAKVFLDVEVQTNGHHVKVLSIRGVKVKYGRAILRMYKAKRGTIVPDSQIKTLIDDKLIYYVRKSLEKELKPHMSEACIIMKDREAFRLYNRYNAGFNNLINRVLDSKIAMVKKQTHNGNYPTHDLDLNFEKTPLLITYTGNVRLTEGTIGNFTTFKRVGRLAYFGNVGDKFNYIVIRVSMADLYAYFEEVDINVWGYDIIHFGGVIGTPEHIVFDIAVNVSMSVRGFVVKVNDVAVIIRDIGRTTTHIESLGEEIGFILSFTQDLIADLFHGIFVMLLEQAIEDILRDHVVNKTIVLSG